MIKVKIDPVKLTRSFLPIHKRQPNRIAILNALLSPLYSLYNDFSTWQEYTRSFRITSQTIVLENYLRSKYNAPQIVIETSHDGGVEVSMRIEGRFFIDAGSTAYKEIHLNQEMQEYFNNCDFVVHTPKSVPFESIYKEIERFRRAGKKAIIKQA